MSFSFDFAADAEEGGRREDSAQFKKSIESNNDANELIAKLIERSKNNAKACTFVNASSEVLPNDDSHKTTINAKEEFQPHLCFHDHERIDLMSTKMDNLRYVMPKHTLSDDTTDLIPGVYEGGMKVWECSIDLCRFLAHIIDEGLDNEHHNDSNIVDALVRCLGPSGLTMEIGCGHGLPGCLILRENIRRGFNNCDQNKSVVIFSDFNDFVLHHATIPNAQVNVCGLRGDDGVAMDECQTAKAMVERSIFVGGDWMGLSHKLSNGNLPLQVEDGRLDLILATETTYTPESCRDTAFLMLSHLKIDVGVGLVATKRFYFGVGGGTDLFTIACKELASDQGLYAGLQLSVRTVQSYDTGNANIRDLLEVTCQKKLSRTQET